MVLSQIGMLCVCVISKYVKMYRVNLKYIYFFPSWIRSSITKAFGKQPGDFSEVESDISFIGSNRPSSDGFDPGRMSKVSVSSDGSMESKGSEFSYMNDQFSSISFESVSYILNYYCIIFILLLLLLVGVIVQSILWFQFEISG